MICTTTAASFIVRRFFLQSAANDLSPQMQRVSRERKFRLALELFVDFVPPARRDGVSLAVIGFVILNLEPALRNRRPYRVLSTVVAADKEPSLTFNAYFAPIVDQLNELYVGLLQFSCAVILDFFDSSFHSTCESRLYSHVGIVQPAGVSRADRL